MLGSQRRERRLVTCALTNMVPTHGMRTRQTKCGMDIFTSCNRSMITIPMLVSISALPSASRVRSPASASSTCLACLWRDRHFQGHDFQKGPTPADLGGAASRRLSGYTCRDGNALGTAARDPNRSWSRGFAQWELRDVG